jgi:hypothetical protein
VKSGNLITAWLPFPKLSYVIYSTTMGGNPGATDDVFAKEQKERQAEKAKESKQSEIMDIRPKHGLPEEDSVHKCVGLLERSGKACMKREKVTELGKQVAEGRIIRVQIARQQVLAPLSAAYEQRSNHGDAKAASDVPRQVVDAGAAAHLLVGESAHGEGGKRNKQKTVGETVDEVWPNDIPNPDVKIEITEKEQRQRADADAHSDQQAAIDLAD